MSALDPQKIFSLIAEEIPAELHPHMLVIGSLAAAYHYRERLARRAINTKDADVVIRPAGALKECRLIASRLIASGWTRRHNCVPQPSPGISDEHHVIRLCPPSGTPYFVEFLGFPDAGQQEPKRMIPIELDDGWYVLPTFRFLRLVAHDECTSEEGLRYAAPSMMALSNLLAHPTLGTHIVSEPIGGVRVLRSAKDLGRVLALARLATTRTEVEAWSPAWEEALFGCHPHSEAVVLAQRLGDGLRALIDSRDALEDARHAADVGLLGGLGVTAQQLRALAAQVLTDAVDPLAERARSRTLPGR